MVGQHGADLIGQRWVNRLARLDDQRSGLRIIERCCGVAADDALGKRLQDAVARGVAQRDAGGGATVFLADDDVLSDVDQAAREIAGLGRSKRRVGETLASSVGRDEVLQYSQPLPEVR